MGNLSKLKQKQEYSQIRHPPIPDSNQKGTRQPYCSPNQVAPGVPMILAAVIPE